MGTTGCDNDKPKYDKNQKVNGREIEWNISMGVNYLGDRALTITFTNNSKYDLTEVYLTFSLKENIKEETKKEFYDYLIDEYELKGDDLKVLEKDEIEMNGGKYYFDFDDNKALEVGESVTTSLDYGSYFIFTDKYIDLFRPSMLSYEFTDENGKEISTYYDYINKKYTNY